MVKSLFNIVDIAHTEEPRVKMFIDRKLESYNTTPAGSNKRRLEGYEKGYKESELPGKQKINSLFLTP